jgi:hypothetical protein
MLDALEELPDDDAILDELDALEELVEAQHWRLRVE